MSFKSNLINIVLVETSHPGNIGSVARAMKTMGLSSLSLVNPRKFPSGEANALSGNAVDVLENAKIFNSLEKDIIRITVRVVGQGDYLPTYAGNLDIITSSAVHLSNYINEK